MPDGTSNVAPRDRLSAAISARGSAQTRAVEANAIVARAGSQLAEAKAQLEQFAGLDERIAAHRAEAIRAGTSATDLPADLGAARRQRAAAEIEVSDASRAHSLLAADAERAVAAWTEAQVAACDAAVAVVRAEADELAERLAAHQQAAFACKIKLSALGAFHVPVAGAPRPFPLSKFAIDALTMPAEPYSDVLPGPNGPEARATALWVRYLAALQADPAAQRDQAAAAAKAVSVFAADTPGAGLDEGYVALPPTAVGALENHQ